MTVKILVRTFICAIAMISGCVFAGQQFITVGTGSVTGVYYPAGGAICKLVNESRQQHHIRCSVEASAGSVYNVNAIRSGDLDLGIVQSDWQYHAYHGSSKFAHMGEFNKMRALFSLHSEAFNIIASTGSGIHSLQDLRGKRVNIGNPGSGDRATMSVVMQAMGWTAKDFKPTIPVSGAERSQALCEDKIDAYIYMAGHPNGAIKEASLACNAQLIPVEGAAIDQIIATHPYYTHTTVPAGTYPGINRNIHSFGVVATLVTSADLPDDIAYNVVKNVFEHFDEFKHLHPAFANLSKSDMISAGISIPLHSGAIRYYKEAGLLK